jgi:hypothetical protein
LALAASVLVTAFPCPAAAADPGQAAPRIFGLSEPGPGYGFRSASETANSLGRSLQVVNGFEAWNFHNPFPIEGLRAIAATGARPEITWEPWDPNAGVTQPEYSLARIAAGAFDGYIAGWAYAAAAYGAPLLLRFAHEMTGVWYPWSPAVNGGSSAAYVAAWRHVHDVFAAAGAHNVSWVWSPNVVEGEPTTLAEVYPGAAYVDIVAVDGYNVGSDKPEWGGWKGPEQLFAATIGFCSQLAPDKPLWINEIGSTEHGGDKAAWIASLFDYLRTTRVTGVIWYDSPVESRDYRLNSSPTSFGAAAYSLHHW